MDDLTEANLRDKIYDVPSTDDNKPSYNGYDELDYSAMGGSPYVGGNVVQSYIFGKPVNAILEAVVVVVILGLVIYVLTQSSAGSGFVWTAGILLVGYFVWNQVGPFVTPFLPSPLRNLLQ